MRGEMMFFNNKPKELLSREQVARDVELIISRHKEDRIKEEDFVDDSKEGYTSKDIFNDLKMLMTMEEQFEKRDEHFTAEEIERIKQREGLSEALEVAVVAGGQRVNWFGENAYLIRAARFDDVFNGTDAFLEFDMGEDEPFRIALAIDASMSRDIHIIEKKMVRGVQKIEKGHMEVKYFQSKVDDFKGKLTMVVPIVLGIESHNAQQLVHLFAELERAAGDPDKEKKIEQQLSQNPAQIVMLKEMTTQLDMYATLFRRNGSYIRHATERVRGLLEDIIKQKDHVDSDEMERGDKVYGLVQSICAKKKMEYQQKR
ncbi:MAG TPA: hypothetical protein VF817_01175 [Patescibacteria group bacterium]